MWCQNFICKFFGFVTKHACDGQTDRQTDERTDGQNYDPQDRASYVASRGKNGKVQKLCGYVQERTPMQGLALSKVTVGYWTWEGNHNSPNKYSLRIVVVMSSKRVGDEQNIKYIRIANYHYVVPGFVFLALNQFICKCWNKIYRVTWRKAVCIYPDGLSPPLVPAPLPGWMGIVTIASSGGLDDSDGSS